MIEYRWLAAWSGAAYEGFELFGITFPPQTDGRSAQVKYILVYSVIIFFSVIAGTLRSLWAGKYARDSGCHGAGHQIGYRLTSALPPPFASDSVAGGARCAEKMFAGMLHRILRAPMSYFDTTPLGRTLNRFTYDVEVMDIELSIAMVGVMISSSWLFSSVIVMVLTFCC